MCPFPLFPTAGCTTSVLLADPGDVQEAMVHLLDRRLRIKQIMESCWKARGCPDTPTQNNGQLSSFCPVIPFRCFPGITLATRILRNLIVKGSTYLNSSRSTSLDRFTISTPGMMVIPTSWCLRSDKNSLDFTILYGTSRQIRSCWSHISVHQIMSDIPYHTIIF